jgi:Domain of unknown function (DUF4129)
VSGSADSARRLAASILAERRFHPPSVPRPLHGLLHAIGTAVRSAGNAVIDAVNDVGKLVPGGAAAVWTLLALVLVASAVIVARRRALATRRASDNRAAVREARERAEELERRADRAEREGRFADAVRLRFRAGVARLAEHGEVPHARSTPSAQLAQVLGSSDFEELARRFDEIVYGSDPADPADAEDARRRWRAVLSGGRT